MSEVPRITILVTCVGGRLIYDVIKALREVDDFAANIIGIDADPESHGRLLCDRFEVLPMAEKEPEKFLKSLMALHEEQPIDVLLALSEGEARLVSKHRDELIDLGMRVSSSSYETVITMTDKLLMLERITQKGIHSTPFFSVDSLEDFDHALKELGYGSRKVVFKPRRAAGSRGVLIADATHDGFMSLLPERFCGTGNRDAVLEAMAKEGMELNEIVAVPYVGGNVFDVDCIAKKGQLIDFAARRRQLKNPLWPTSTGHKVDLRPDVREYASQLCKAFSVDGAGDFDIAVDEGGKPVLFDAGARFSGSVGGTLTAGGNFPAQLVRSLMKMPCPPMAIRDQVVLRPYLTMAEIPEVNETDLL